MTIATASDYYGPPLRRHGDKPISMVQDMPPADALRALTLHGATVLGIQDRVGTIAPGMDSDLVAVAGNPLEDIESLRRVVSVMLSGRMIT
ncbi:amidohydrolase family protein [Nonomuraea sediminis]|uniref:amidohydrolase family protein n=1 Tax=Nonomuraea sediminis TaxID=2835864 RepID=UPI001BDBE01C|nr:amidohydrolase family protein [Nonomuraea sediminis]